MELGVGLLPSCTVIVSYLYFLTFFCFVGVSAVVWSDDDEGGDDDGDDDVDDVGDDDDAVVGIGSVVGVGVAIITIVIC